MCFIIKIIGLSKFFTMVNFEQNIALPCIMLFQMVLFLNSCECFLQIKQIVCPIYYFFKWETNEAPNSHKNVFAEVIKAMHFFLTHFYKLPFFHTLCRKKYLFIWAKLVSERMDHCIKKVFSSSLQDVEKCERNHFSHLLISISCLKVGTIESQEKKLSKLLQ